MGVSTTAGPVAGFFSAAFAAVVSVFGTSAPRFF